MRQIVQSWMAALAVFAALAAPAPARACPQHYETYHAEANSLPCVLDTLLGLWPKHTPEFYETQAEAFDYALAWAPYWTDGLDARGVVHMRLGQLEEARRVMSLRHEVAPEAYASHANLGTLYTFTGDDEAALRHIDTALAKNPQAHFGRETYHRQLVEFLGAAKRDPAVLTTRNFLGVEVSAEDRAKGSPQLYRARGLEDEAIDALVSMITVYGAAEMAEIYLALGELLALRGHPRLAWTAYQRALELKHPRAKQLIQWQRQLEDRLREEFAAPGRREERYRGLMTHYLRRTKAASELRAAYAAWEREQLRLGLPIWDDAGMKAVYEHMGALRYRCATPAIVADPAAPETAAPVKEGAL
ncbi:hypothetical protein [Nannocystis sp. SCPEA4]|uniref:tetratricopeptide repeat protein n=1 Tax=Nannocystis sp. SCPEA4 TaxID=2996787 RepID=UPI00227087BE|nr:hypothetical protein [Nannocystis sp. SCPEA4]MCY1060069.1 hypothetical protein [Nannocystis sp. SCPEA4]